MIGTDTIAAVATAMSNSGIGIIRISGDNAIEAADAVFRTKGGKRILSHVESHTMHYGYIVDIAALDIMDEVMVSVMKAPRSYTTEDTVEINCHGGVLMMQRILENVLKAGVRLAEPGEFTKRAFLNGRIDLSQAEAVIDIIDSRNEFALKSSVNQLKGSVSAKIKELREKLLYEIAFIESALDDPEHISLDRYPASLSEKLKEWLSCVAKLLQSTGNGKILKEGINTVIVGKPNAGKSSLLNILVGEDKAIVTEIAGTTRDVLEEHITLHGISLNIIDTAGIRFTEDIVEKLGVEKARKYAATADLILYVADSSVPLDDSDRDIMGLIGDKKCIILLNKTDLSPAVTSESLLQVFCEVCRELSGPEDKTDRENSLRIIRTSTKDNTGIEMFEECVRDMFLRGEITFNEEVIITNMRHKQALEETHSSLLQVQRSLEMDMPEDFYSIDLMSAYSSLGTIIGEEVGDDLVEEIFSRFCMGK